ncbi:MAG: outer membrane beta-barrel protein [Chitinophagales bacterium]
MKKLMLVLALCIGLKSYAQSFEVGVKGGVNYSQSVVLDVVGADGVDMDDIENEKGMGLVFGGYVRGTFGKFIFQPELLFSEDQSSVVLADANPENFDLGDILSINIDKIDVPLLVGYKAFNRIRLMAGPVVSNIRSSSSDPLFSFSDLSIGYQAGIGFDIERLVFDARYEGNLSKFENYIETDNGIIQVDSRTNIFQFTVGYKLFK